MQLIAANIDTVFIVSSCNKDFNLARLERYLALAYQAEATPVILLTKADMAEDPDHYVVQAQTLGVEVLALDARSTEVSAALAPWCRRGQTVAFLGSSGVGKSTLVAALTGAEIATAGIREDDAKGRHTPTHRQLHLIPGGCAVLDTPGMRELQLTDAAEGLGDVFNDLPQLATQCRFADCQHETEPGCAVLHALETGALDPARLRRWRKLMAEDAHNTATLAERRSRSKAFGKMYRRIQKEKRNR